MYIFYEQRHLTFDAFHTNDLTFLPHLHSQVELIYACEGSVSITIGANQRKMEPGDFAVAFPNTVHSYATPGHSKCFIIIFNPEHAGEYHKTLNAMCPLYPFIPRGGLHEDVVRILHMLQESDGAGIHWDKKLLRGYLMVLTGRMLESLPLDKEGHSTDPDLLHRLLSYIGQHFQENLSLDLVARHLSVSKYHLSRCFSQKIGCNFNTYINSLRVQYAENMLLDTGRSISEICREAGFESLNTFYRAFAQSFGETPGNHRKRLHQELH